MNNHSDDLEIPPVLAFYASTLTNASSATTSS